jgi:hypothetical protein
MDEARTLVQLTHEKIALIDTADLVMIQPYRWAAIRAGKDRPIWYAITKSHGKRIYMHRLILQATTGMEVDHRDHNGLHNWRANLRLATHAQNVSSQRKQARRGDSYKGVHFYSAAYRPKPWFATIKHHGKTRFLGYYATPQEAAMAYDRAAKMLFGEYAVVNFP